MAPKVRSLVVNSEAKQQLIRDKSIEGIKALFPILGTHHDIDVDNLEVAPKQVDYEVHKQALYKRGTLYEPLKGNVVIKDKQGNIVDRKNGHVLLHVPRVSWNGAFLIKGNEYAFKNQLRTMPGVYTRQRDNGELEASFNLAKGANFRVNMEPEKGVLNLEYGTTKIPAYPILRSQGLSHSDISNYWGKDLADRNASQFEGKSDSYISKLYEKVVPSSKRTATSIQDKVSAITDHYNNTVLSGKVTEMTLGKPFDKVTPESILLAGKKLVNVYNGKEDEDERDSLEFQRVMGAEDMFKERIRLKGKELSFKIKNKLDLAKDVKVGDVLPSTLLAPTLKQYISTSQLSMIPAQINPIELTDSTLAVTRLGEGGIGEDRAIPADVRSLSASAFGIIDPFRTPESSAAGVDVRFTFGAGRDDEGYLYSKLKNSKTGEIEWVPARNMKKLNIAFPMQDTKKGNVDVLSKGRVAKVKPKEVDYEMSSIQNMYTASTNMVPFLDSTQGNRIIMGSKMVGQAVPLVNREAPLVQPSANDSVNDISMEDAMAKIVDMKATVEGTVTGVTKDKISIKSKDGSIKDIVIANHVPMASKTFFTHTPSVKVGDSVSPDSVIAESNYTKNGQLALGKNLKIAYMAYHGINSNDAVVISKSAADKMKSVKMSKYLVELDSDMKLDDKKHSANFPRVFNKDQYSKLQDGVVRVGEKLASGDPIATVLMKKSPSIENQILGKIHKSLRSEYDDRSEVWNGEETGEVVDVQRHGNKVTVVVKSEEPVKIGDKLSNRYGGKGVVGKIVDDESMVRDSSGKPIDMLWSSLSVVSRINPGQVIETALAKAAEKTGKQYKIPSFNKVNNVKFARQELKKAGISDKEDVYDPVTGKTIKNIMVGPQYTYRLFKTTDTNFSARGIDAGYDINKTPSKGGDDGAKGTGMMEINALLAHDARDILKENAVIRGTKNSEYWRAVQLNRPIPPPQSSFVFDKFKGMLAGAGLRMDRSGNDMTLTPLTDKDVSAMSAGEIKNGKMLLSKNLMPERDGLFDLTKTGGSSGMKYSHIELPESVINPLFTDAARRLLGVTETKLNEMIVEEGGDSVRKKLDSINLDEELVKAKSDLKRLKGAEKDNAYKKVKAINALKANNMKPGDAYAIKKFPVIPPTFRPIVPGPGGDLLVSDVNHMYKDLILAKEKLQEAKDLDLPDSDIKEMRQHLQQSAGAVIGVNPPVSAKLVQSEVKGIVNTITGTKTGFYNGKVLAKRLDLTGRGTAAPDPNLGMDEIGLPEEMMWGMYSPFIIKNLVKRGYPAVQAKELVDKKSSQAREELMIESRQRPVYINRAPTLHRFNIIAANPIPVEGKTIKVNPFLEDGMNLDYDGDALQVHLPATDLGIKDAKKMMLSNNLFGDRTREQLLAYPKMEAIAGIYKATEAMPTTGSDKAPKRFATIAEAKAAYRKGTLKASDIVQIDKDDSNE
jgi:DNA-directed RNA polymerase beta subunit